MTDTRDAFEAWARKECNATNLDLRWNQHGYIWNEWERAFKSWQAATLSERERESFEQTGVQGLVKPIGSGI